MRRSRRRASSATRIQSFQQVSGRDLQRLRKPDDVHEGNVPLAAFSAAHVRAIDARFGRKLLLRESGPLTGLAQVLAKTLQDVGSGECRHGVGERKWCGLQRVDDVDLADDPSTDYKYLMTMSITREGGTDEDHR